MEGAAENRFPSGTMDAPSMAEELLEIGKRCALLPGLDKRSDEEILAYNRFGAW